MAEVTDTSKHLFFAHTLFWVPQCRKSLLVVVPFPLLFALVGRRLDEVGDSAPDGDVEEGLAIETGPSVLVAVSGAVTGAAAVLSEAPVAHEAPVAVGTRHSWFAVAESRPGVASPAAAERGIDCTRGLAGTGFADLWRRHGLPSVSVKAWFAPLAPMSLSVVLAVVTDSPTALPRGQPNAQIEVAALGVVVAATLSAFIWCPCFPISWLPRLVIVQWSTFLTVVPCRVVSAHTLPMDHVLHDSCPVGKLTFLCMPIAKAASPDDQVINSIVGESLGFLYQS